jgi:hypothetical protein
MARIAWRTAISGFLLLLATYSEGSPAHVGDCFLPSTLATTVPTAADFPLLCAAGGHGHHAHHARNLPHLGDRSDSNRS